MFTILHISDLHRSPYDPISNAELISALVGDRERYIKEDPKICQPDAIIVSGDIIQGVPLGTPNYKSELIKQYEVAENFLIDLVNHFLSGDRSRIILIPGNHDVDWNTAFLAMKEIDSKELKDDFGVALQNDSSKYRWDWKKRKAYQIEDEQLYAKRLDAFWLFFEKFYYGQSGLLKVMTNADANLFKLCNDRIGLAAYNSCHGNDCFALHGMIPKEVIAKSYLELKEFGTFDLQIAIWHHNIEGPPYRTDYMDIEIIKGMIGRGFRLGLYGHQHKAQATPHQIWLPDKERMVVVSAGSLCAGRYDLPTGTPRQYNILEIAEDFKSVRIHVREMLTANLFSRGRFGDLGGGSFVDFDLDPPRNPVGGIVNTKEIRSNSLIQEAEIASKSGDANKTLELLSKINLSPGSYERKLFLQTAYASKNWMAILNITSPPKTIEELIFRFDAFSHLNDFKSAAEALENFSQQLQFPDKLKQELLDRINIQKQIKQ